MLIDPLDPPPEVRGADHVLVTVYWHGRSTESVEAEHVWSPSRSAQPLRNRRIGVTDVFRPADALPGGIRAFQTARSAEVVYWLPEQRALAVGDVLLGAGAKPRPTDEPLRLCPASWLGKQTHEDLRVSLRPLLDLPLECLLVSHGKPVLSNGHTALAAVLQPADSALERARVAG